MAGKNNGKVRCSFCGRPQSEVKKLIAGPEGSYICDECVETCMDDEETRYEIEAEKQKIKMLKEKRKIIEKKCN